MTTFILIVIAALVLAAFWQAILKVAIAAMIGGISYFHEFAYDLLAENKFKPAGHDSGPYALQLGISEPNSVLMGLGVLIAVITYGTGRTNVLAGVVHLTLLAAYLFLTFVP